MTQTQWEPKALEEDIIDDDDDVAPLIAEEPEDDAVEIVTNVSENDANQTWQSEFRSSSQVVRKRTLRVDSMDALSCKLRKTAGKLEYQFQRVLTRLKGQGGLNISESKLDVPHLDVVIILDSNIGQYFSTVCRCIESDEYLHVIFLQSIRHCLALQTGTKLRIWKPFSEVFINNQKVIVATFFIELLDSELLDTTEDLEKLMDEPENPHLNETIMTQTPIKKIQQKSNINSTVFVKDIIHRIPLNPLTDLSFNSVSMVGIIQRVFKRREFLDVQVARHVDFCKFNHHLLVVTEKETNTICFVQIPLDEREYWGPVLKAQGQTIRLNNLRLSGVDLILSKNPYFSILSSIQEKSNFKIFEFSIHIDTTYEFLFDFQTRFDSSQTESQLEIVQKSLEYIPLEIVTCKSLLDKPSGIRVNLECFVAHFEHFDDPILIMYVKDEHSAKILQIKVLDRICLAELKRLDTSYFCFTNLLWKNNDIIFDTFSRIRGSTKEDLVVKFDVIASDLYSIGWVNQDFVKIESSDIFINVCGNCKVACRKGEICKECFKMVNSPTKEIEFQVLLKHNYHVVVNRDMFYELCQKVGMFAIHPKNFKEMEEICKGLDWSFEGIVVEKREINGESHVFVKAIKRRIKFKVPKK